MNTTRDKFNKGSGSNPHANHSRAAAPQTFLAHCQNRRLDTETVLNHLRTKLPQLYELAEVVGKWVWLDVSPAGNPFWQKCFGRLAFIGTIGAAFGSILAASLTRLARIPPTRAAKYRCFFPADVIPA